MITSLTQDQIDKFPEYVEKWTKIGLSTEPANRPAAEIAIHKCYELAGLNPPKDITWSDSPLSQGALYSSLREKRLESAMKIPLGENLRDRVWNQIRNLAQGSVSYTASGYVMGCIWDKMANEVCNRVFEGIWRNIWEDIWRNTWGNVWGDTLDKGQNISAKKVVYNTFICAGTLLYNTLFRVLKVLFSFQKNSLYLDFKLIKSRAGESIWKSGYGQHDAHWLAFYDFFRTELGLIKETERLQGLTELSKHAGWFIPCKNVCLVSERPRVLNLDDQGRLHCLDGPALAYPDGWEIYAVKGVTQDQNPKADAAA